MFKCRVCNNKLDLPKCLKCGYEIPVVNSIYQFSDDPSIKLEGEDKYIGYDNIGEDFEPEIIYWNTNNIERFGVYEACSDVLAKSFGRDINILDLGAGLGTASIPLAKHGMYIIAADISNVMLSTAVKRSKGRYSNLVFARMNAYNLMIEDNSIDIVVENSMIHLIDNPEKVLKEIIRILKPNGCLIRYGSFAYPLTREEEILNKYCNSVLNDISCVYYKSLEDLGYKSTWQCNNSNEKLKEYFEVPYNIVVEGFTEVFTEKLKFRLHKLKTGAHSELQNIPEEWINTAWNTANKYAIEKYGEDYINIQGFSRYGAVVDVYKVKA